MPPLSVCIMGFIKFKFEKDEEEKPIEIPINISKLSKIKISKKGKKESPREKSFVLDWETELEYTGNPFNDEMLSPVSDFVAGYEKERDKINLFIINNYRFGSITGGKGSGKTTLLKWLYEQLSEYSDKLVVKYLRGNKLGVNVSLIKTIVEPMLSLYDKRVEKIGAEVDIDKNTSVLRKKLGKKKLILLIDDIHAISKENIVSLNRMYATLQLQVVATYAKESQLPFETSGELKDHLKIHLKGLSLEESTDMIKKRIKHFGGKGIAPFDHKHLLKIHKEAESNPKKIINLCQHYAIEASLKWRKKKAEMEKKNMQELGKMVKGSSDSDNKSNEHPDYNEKGEVILKPLEESERSKGYTIQAVKHGGDSIIIPAGSGHKKQQVIKTNK